MSATVTVLLLAFCLCQIGQVLAANRIWIAFSNACHIEIRISVHGNQSGKLILAPYETVSFILCSSFCKGFFGASKTYHYSYEARSNHPAFNYNWDLKSSEISVSESNAFGTSAHHSFSCADEPKPELPQERTLSARSLSQTLSCNDVIDLVKFCETECGDRILKDVDCSSAGPSCFCETESGDIINTNTDAPTYCAGRDLSEECEKECGSLSMIDDVDCKNDEPVCTCAEVANLEPGPEPKAEPAQLEKFNFAMEWNPSSCSQDSCSDNRVLNAFTVGEMDPKLLKRDTKNDRCWDKSSDESTDLIVGNEVSRGTLEALKCIFQNSAGVDEDLWRTLYVDKGSCSGLSVSDYFDLIVKLYTSLNLNKIGYDFGIYNRNAIIKTEVDRDEFLDFINAESGKKAWIECDPDEKILKRVLFCTEPYPPYNVIDCTMDRNDPTATNGIPCDGTLRLPKNSNGGYVPDTCQPYIPYGISTNWVEPETSDVSNGDLSGGNPSDSKQNSESGGLNIPALVGGVVGGFVALILIAGLFVWLHLRKKRNLDMGTKASGGYASKSVSYQPNTVLDSAYTKNGFDPYKSHIDYLLMQAGQKGKLGQNEFDFHRVQLGGPIGEGSFGRVYRGNYRGKDVALKIFLEQETIQENSLEGMAAASKGIVEKMEKEVRIVAELDHPNIVKYLGYSKIPPCIMTELCPRGNLAQKLAKTLEMGIPFPWKERLCIALDIGEGLQYLHMRSVVHRDLKSPNILLNEQSVAKISDFNLSKIIDGSINHSSVAAMNPRWLAPELFDGGKPSRSCDIFSFGVILWELISLEVPWGNQNPWIIAGKVKSGERLKAAHDANLCSAQSFKKYSNLMTECWKQEKHLRISLQSALDILRSLHKAND